MAYRLKRFSGRLVKYWHSRGCGFVKIDGLSRDAIVYVRNFDEPIGFDQLRTGTRLEFYLAQHPGGLRAIRCTIKG